MVVAMFALGYLSSLAIRIHRESTFDDARAADVIIVMGAAEYSGRPSPVLKLRLEAVELSEEWHTQLSRRTRVAEFAELLEQTEAAA